MKSPVISPRRVTALAPLLTLLLLTGCQPDNDRSRMNPRKEVVYRYASSLYEIDEQSTVMSSGPMGAPTNHPARLKSPYPTRADMEATIGPADVSDTQKVRYPVEGGLGKEGEEDNLTLIWRERDSTWEKYGKNGMEKPGYREIIIAWFDREGRLKKLFVRHPVGSEFIGRDSSSWQWAG